MAPATDPRGADGVPGIACGGTRKVVPLDGPSDLREEVAMRLEATVPDSHGTAAIELADELGLSRSQLIDEALTLFLKAVLEVRRGRRLVTVTPGSEEPACDMATPTLAALEWAQKPEQLLLPAKSVARMRQLAEASARPGARLREGAKRHAR